MRKSDQDYVPKGKDGRDRHNGTNDGSFGTSRDSVGRRSPNCSEQSSRRRRERHTGRVITTHLLLVGDSSVENVARVRSSVVPTRVLFRCRFAGRGGRRGDSRTDRVLRHTGKVQPRKQRGQWERESREDCTACECGWTIGDVFKAKFKPRIATKDRTSYDRWARSLGNPKSEAEIYGDWQHDRDG